jgi:hypothetical protein
VIVVSGLLKLAIEGPGGARLLRRLDCSVDILGGAPAVHYPSQYREFGGTMVPTRRRVYVRNPDGSPVRDSVPVHIGSTDATFSWEHTIRVDGIGPLLPTLNDPALAAS